MQHINHWHVVAIPFFFFWVLLPISSLITHHAFGGWRTSLISWICLALFTIFFMYGFYIGAGWNLGFWMLLPLFGGGWLYTKVCSYLERYDVWKPEKPLDASRVRFIIVKLVLITALSAWLVNYLPAPLLCMAILVAVTCLVTVIRILVEFWNEHREIDKLQTLIDIELDG